MDFLRPRRKPKGIMPAVVESVRVDTVRVRLRCGKRVTVIGTSSSGQQIREGMRVLIAYIGDSKTEAYIVTANIGGGSVTHALNDI